MMKKGRKINRNVECYKGHRGKTELKCPKRDEKKLATHEEKKVSPHSI
jgi:hypothetical protein